MKVKIIIVLLITALVPFVSLCSNKITPPAKQSINKVNRQAPKGNWIADVDIQILIVTIKTVYCDRKSDEICTRSSSSADRTKVEALMENGDWKTLGEGILVGQEYNEEQNWIKFTFESDGYIDYK